MGGKWTDEDQLQWEWCQKWAKEKRKKKKFRKKHWEKVKFYFRSMVYELKCLISNIF